MIYKVNVTYPNGNVEEIEEAFSTLNEAKTFGQNLLNQVGYNANYKGSILDDEGVRHVKPFFIIIEKNNNESKIVFDSRK